MSYKFWPIRFGEAACVRAVYIIISSQHVGNEWPLAALRSPGRATGGALPAPPTIIRQINDLKSSVPRG